MGRQVPAIALGLARFLAACPLHRRLGFLLRRLKHALCKFSVLQGQVELIRRKLLGALAELLSLRRAQDIL